MQFNLYIFNQLFRTTLALTSVLVGIIWLFQTIKILELLVNRGAAVGDFLDVHCLDAAMAHDRNSDFWFYRSELGVQPHFSRS